MCKEREISKKGHNALNILSTIAFAIVALLLLQLSFLIGKIYFRIPFKIVYVLHSCRSVIEALFNTHRKMRTHWYF